MQYWYIRTSADLREKKLIYIGDGDLHRELQMRYPHTRLLQKSNDFYAMRLVTNNPDVVMWNNLITAAGSHQISRSRLAITEPQDYWPLNFAFAIHWQNLPLQTALNDALAKIPASTRYRLVQSWSLPTPAKGRSLRLGLTPAEDEWLAQHRRINVYVDNNSSPLAMTNDKGQGEGIVVDFLNTLSASSGVHNISTSPISLPDIFRSLLTLFKPAATAKNMELRAVIDSGETLIDFDKTLLNQIISNLISNAIKFTDSGFVEVALNEGHPLNDALRYFVIDVSDSGISLDHFQQQAVFEPFVQVDDKKRSDHGTGLGLSICRQLVARLGGILTVESEPGQGSTFIFCFHSHYSQGDEISENAPPLIETGDARNVIIVDDHAPNLPLLSQQVRIAVHEAVAVESAEQALLSWDNTLSPLDVVINDCNMPGTD